LGHLIWLDEVGRFAKLFDGWFCFIVQLEQQDGSDLEVQA